MTRVMATLPGYDDPSGSSGFLGKGRCDESSPESCAGERSGRGGGGARQQFAGLTDWADYTLTAKVEPLSVAADGYVAIVARSTSATSFYRLALAGGNHVRLESVKSGTATVLGEASPTVAGGTAYTLGLTVSGNTLSGSVDGAPVVTATASPFCQGADRPATGDHADRRLHHAAVLVPARPDRRRHGPGQGGRGGRQDLSYQAVQPPSTITLAPVT